MPDNEAVRCAREFLEAMFVQAEHGTHAVICSFPRNPRDAGAQWAGQGWWPGSAVPPWFADQNSYVAISTFIPGWQRDRQTGRRVPWYPRRQAHFAGLHAVMIDDVGTKVAGEKLLLPPTALIETSPGNFQAFLFVAQDAASRNATIAALLIDRMVAAGLTKDGADPGMKGVTRYGRLPCGINGKAEYVQRLGHPFPVRCCEFEPTRRYTLDQIAGAFGLEVTVPPPRIARPATATEMESSTAAFDTLLRFLQSVGMYRRRNGAGWHEIECPWTHSHTSATASGTALAEPSEANDWSGGFKCHHGHCEQRGIGDVWEWIGLLVNDVPDVDSTEVLAAFAAELQGKE